ncbi:hypothetical protein A7Q09_05370 [Methylacidiphilum sp. Yel]|nr:hypothetical protein A7Q09_05370 [Methylacidiphilum sp. Yel]
MSHPHPRDDSGDDSTLVRNVGDFPPAQQPAPVPPASEPRLHLTLVHPVAGQHPVGRIGQALQWYLRELGVLGAGGLVRVVTKPVVELVDHLGFIQREIPFRSAQEDVPFETIALGLELIPGAEEMRIARHVEQALRKRHAPRIARLAFGLLHQHRDAAVDVAGELGVAGGAEDGRGAGVGVDQAQVLGRKGEAALGMREVGCVVAEEGELRGAGRSEGAGEGEEAELVAAVHTREEPLPVLEVV